MIKKRMGYLGIILALVALVSLGPTTVWSQDDNTGSSETMEAPQGPPPGGHKKPGGFEKDDADNDGKVTRQEFSGPADMFDRLDADGDGVITQEEARPPRGGHGKPPGKQDRSQ